MVLADFTFGQALLTVLEIFVFAAWLMILFSIFGDLFRDHELSGWGKAAWSVFLIFVPFLGALIYMIARGSGMRERALQQQQQTQQQMDAYIRQTAGGGGARAHPLTSSPSSRSCTTSARSPTRSSRRRRPRSSPDRPSCRGGGRPGEWAILDSNQGPRPYQRRALTN